MGPSALQMFGGIQCFQDAYSPTSWFDGTPSSDSPGLTLALVGPVEPASQTGAEGEVSPSLLHRAHTAVLALKLLSGSKMANQSARVGCPTRPSLLKGQLRASKCRTEEAANML